MTQGVCFIDPLPLCTPRLKRTAFRKCAQMSSTTSPPSRATRAPIVVSDVLDTLVADPFFNGMHKHFNFESFDSFVRAKTPDIWVQFELGQIDEAHLARNFFRDGRQVDLNSFKSYLRGSYKLLPGVEHMLNMLRDRNVEVHLCTNYPIWADLIEDTLALSSRFGVQWTFISAKEQCRKPDRAAYERVAEKAGVLPAECVLLDDRENNCHGAIEAGYLNAIKFEDAHQAIRDLQSIYKPFDVSFDTAIG